MQVKCPYLSHFPSLKHCFFELDPTTSRSEKVEIMAEQAIPLATLKQVHGNTVLQVKDPTDGQEADGLVTNVRRIALGILTADCGPVLFSDPIAEVIGASHAGWRGAKAGIVQSTLDAMESLGAQRSQIYAALGPTIQQEHYEVGPEFPELIGEVYENYFKPSQKKQHHYFNLPLYIKDILKKEKLSEIYDVEANTFTGRFASRRRLLSEGVNQIEFHNFSAIAII